MAEEPSAKRARTEEGSMDVDGGAAGGGGAGAAAAAAAAAPAVTAQRSWLEFDPERHGFGLQNIPWGVCARPRDGVHVCATRVGDWVRAGSAAKMRGGIGGAAGDWRGMRGVCRWWTCRSWCEQGC
jgi:hypothetical protein